MTICTNCSYGASCALPATRESARVFCEEYELSQLPETAQCDTQGMSVESECAGKKK